MSNPRTKGMVKPGTNLTVWGMLSLEENPTMPEDVKGLGDAISAKVPRIITLRGNSNYIGRVKRTPTGHAQTVIELSYISSSHCCLFLRAAAGGNGIEAAVLDTSSNGTSVNGQKLGKKVTRALKQGDEIALYLPQSATPLGHTILYRLVLNESNMHQAMLEEPPKLPAANRLKSRSGASVPADLAAGSSRDLGTSNPGSQSQSQSPSRASASAGRVRGNGSANDLPPDVEFEKIVTPKTGSNNTAVDTRGENNQGSAVRNGGREKGAGRTGGSTPFASPAGSDRNVLEMLDDKVAVKKAAEESARKTWEVERQELIRQIRTLHGSLDKQGKENQRLVSEKNALEDQLAETESSGRDEAERAAREREWKAKMKAAVGEAEAKLNEALRRAKRERDKAEAVGKEEAEAKNVAQRRNEDLQSQVDALIVQQNAQMHRNAKCAADMETTLAEVRDELAEVSMNNSSLTAQLREARESARSLRTKVTEEQQAVTLARQEKAEVEGHLAQREKELLELKQKSRRQLEEATLEANRLAQELQELQAAASRERKELQQALSDLGEVRRLREEESKGRSHLEEEAAELTANTETLTKSLEQANTRADQACGKVAALTAQLSETKKRARKTEAMLSETQNELVRCSNRKDGVKGEAFIMRRNLEKAKKAGQEVMRSVSEQMAELLGHLEIPGGYLPLDSQIDPGAADMAGDDYMSAEDEENTESITGSSPNRGGVDDAQNETVNGQHIITTQVSPGAASASADTRSCDENVVAAAGVVPYDAEKAFAIASFNGGVSTAILAEGRGARAAEISASSVRKGKGRVRSHDEGSDGNGTGTDDYGNVGDGNDDGVQPRQSRTNNGEGNDDGSGTEGEDRGEENDDVVSSGDGKKMGSERRSIGDSPSGDGGGGRRDGVGGGGQGSTDDAGLATASLRLENDAHGGEVDYGDGSDDETEFTVPPLDFGRGTRSTATAAGAGPGASHEGCDGEEDDGRGGGGGRGKGGDAEPEAGRGDPYADTQELTSDEIRLSLAGQLGPATSRQLDSAAAQTVTAAGSSRKRSRSEDFSSRGVPEKKTKMDYDDEDENDRASNDETNADPVEIADLLDDPEYKREADADAATADPTDVAAPGVSAQPITATVAAVGGEAALGDAAVLVSELYKNVVANMGADDDDGRGSQLWLRRGGRAQEKRRSVPETNAAEHEGSGESEEGELA